MSHGRRSIAAATALALAAIGCGPPSSGKSGATLYGELCARCHGDDGSGDARRYALAPGIDLTRSTLVVRGARGLVYQRISQGYGSMPGFGHKLERGDVEELTNFVLGFGRPN